MRLAICTAAYPAAYVVFFLFPVMLKGNVGTGTLDILSVIVNPIVLFVLGFIFARWLGVMAQLLSIILIPHLFSHQTEQIVSIVGNRGYSYESAHELPFVFLGGWICSMSIISGRVWLAKRGGAK